MFQRFIMMMTVGVALLPMYARSDTLYLRSGVQVHGVVLNEEGNRLVVRTGDRIVRISSSSVVKIEENDRDGAFDHEAARKALEEREKQLLEETGLTREQRQEIDALIRHLADPDPVVQGDARRSLTTMAAAPEIFEYLKNQLPSWLPVHIAQLLDVVASAGGMRAGDTLLEYAMHPDPAVRGVSVELLGVIQHRNALEIMLRGLLDHEPVVRMAACAALAAIGAREATPMLIDNLRHANPGVNNYAAEALVVIWGDNESAAALKTAEEWLQFWHAHQESVPRTVDLESLEPLVDKDARFHYCCVYMPRMALHNTVIVV